MSLVILVLGSALNALQFQALTGLGPILRVNFQFSVSTRGVGPAVRTGKRSTRCWPGGIRSVWSPPEFRPVKPLVTIAHSFAVLLVAPALVPVCETAARHQASLILRIESRKAWSGRTFKGPPDSPVL